MSLLFEINLVIEVILLSYNKSRNYKHISDQVHYNSTKYQIVSFVSNLQRKEKRTISFFSKLEL